METPPEEAVIWASPGDTAVTRPLASTVTISGWLLDHTTTAPGMILSFASWTTAVNWPVWPTFVSVMEDGLISMLSAACSTETVAVAVAYPDVTVICVVPLPAAVTTPRSLTRATPLSALRQFTVASAITLLSWSSTVASMRTWSSTAVNTIRYVDSVIVVGSCTGGPEGLVRQADRKDRERVNKNGSVRNKEAVLIISGIWDDFTHTANLEAIQAVEKTNSFCVTFTDCRFPPRIFHEYCSTMC